MDIIARRRYYAEEIEATSNIRSAAIIEALATVPREQFLGPGPWVIRGEADFQAAPRRTADDDPRHVYHNLAIAIDPSRQLFNGAPGLLAMMIDSLTIRPGDRVLHIGSGTGYYTALMAQCTGPAGRVVAFEVDAGLAASARANLSAMPSVDVRCDGGAGPFEESFDAILVNAGMTHPLEAWLDALAPAGRMMLPLTVAVSPTIGKGVVVLITRRLEGDLSGVLEARFFTFVAIYSAVGLRDEARNQDLGLAMKKNPMPRLERLRRDAHDAEPSCWLHGPGWCLTA
jgi:protein-L-isoaspartate(D-aspartate) O-methyltransferase